MSAATRLESRDVPCGSCGETIDALRAALDSVDGRQLIGVINSIGVRRDENAVKALVDRLTDDDNAVSRYRFGTGTAEF